jgi:organic hydroperoxide reductase OsmC/OhrA
MNKSHHYSATITWTGNNGTGTSEYKAYERSYTVSINGKAELLGSSDPSFRGDKTKHNPEDLLLAALSSCHLLSYLHECASNGVVVVEYIDIAKGTMVQDENGGHFTEVTLYPQVIVSHEHMIEKANALHHNANKGCFIANSVNFPVHHQPTAKVKS